MDFTFKGSDGKTYQLGKITFGDMREFVRYCKYRDWYFLRELKNDIPADEYAAESVRLRNECSRKVVTAEDITALTTLPDGMLYLVYLSLRHAHPSITAETVGDVIAMDQLSDIGEMVSMLSGFSDSDDKKPASAAKKKSRS